MVSIACTYGSSVASAGRPHNVFVRLRCMMHPCRSINATVVPLPPISTLTAALFSVLMCWPTCGPLFYYFNRTYVQIITDLQERIQGQYRYFMYKKYTCL